MSTSGYGRQPARIGLLNFKYADPAVNVTTEQRTVEHETIDDNIVVQTLGRKPDQITIDGVVADYELTIVDSLTQTGVVEVRSARWTGDVVVKSTNTDFKRAKTSDGDWLYDASIKCIEVNEEVAIEELIDQFGSVSDSVEEAVNEIQSTGG